MERSILLVEDDESLGATIADQLDSHGYTVQWAKCCADAITFLESRNFQLAILDVGLPDGDGFTLAERIKQLSNSKISIMFLTALSHAEHRLKGFELGAVDFVPKPFHLKELVLRVKNILTDNSPDYRGYSISKKELVVISPTGERVSVSKRDFSILVNLIDSSPEIMSRERLIELIGVDDVTPRTIDNSIVRLRQAFKPIGSELIRSVRGVGYQWCS